MPAGNFTRYASADGAVVVAYFVFELTAAFGFDGRQDVADHAFCQFPFVEGLVSFDLAVFRLARVHAAVGQNRREVQPGLPLRLSLERT